MNPAEMRAEAGRILAEAEAILAASPEGMTAEQETQCNALLEQHKTLIDSAEAAESRVAAQRAAIEARRTAAAAEVAQQERHAQANANTRHIESVSSSPSIRVHATPAPTWSLGEQLLAICQADAGRFGRTVDPRLQQQQVMALASGSTTALPSDGGFFISAQAANDAYKTLYGSGAILSRLRRIPIGANSTGLSINSVDETSRVAGSRFGGVTSYRVGEGEAITTSKPKFKQIKLELKELACAWQVTNMMLDDVSAMSSMADYFFTTELRTRIENEVVRGTGGPQMLGLLNAGCLVTVTRAGSNAISITDVNKMMSRFNPPSKMSPGRVWLVHPETLPQLLAMSVGNQPVYLPGNNVAGGQYSTLWGIPVVECEYCSALGTTGDIVLVDLNEYVYIEKGGISSAQSIHVKFLENESTFRWIIRNDGQPGWTSAITPMNGSSTLSPIIVLS